MTEQELAGLAEAVEDALPYIGSSSVRAAHLAILAEVMRLRRENAELLALLHDRALDSDVAAHAVGVERRAALADIEATREDVVGLLGVDLAYIDGWQIACRVLAQKHEERGP